MPIPIVGHLALREKLLTRCREDKLHSSILLYGPQGIGKRLVASELAQRMLCTDAESLYPCGTCRSCRSFDSENHPDFFYVESEKRSDWNVEAIRELLYGLSLKSFQGNGKVVVFVDVEQLSLACHNILLKTLEEPSESLRFILTTSNPSKIPITIRSRCQQWNVRPLTENELLQVLRERNLIPELQQIPLHASLLADGSLSIFFEFASDIDKFHEVFELLVRISEGSAEAFHTAVSAWGKDKDAFKTVLHFMRIIAREKLTEKESHEELSRWSIFLMNVLSVERLIFDRNINMLLLVQRLLLCLLPPELSHITGRIPNTDASIEQMI